MKGVKVTIDDDYDGPVPFGKNYLAKGAYVQGKYIVVVGNLESGSTIRIKYGKEKVKLEFIID